jgi:hypothetical protein
MITIVAAAFAVEAWKNAVEPLIPLPGQIQGKGHTRIVRTLEQGFDISGQTDPWLNDLRWLFKDVRDTLAHPIETDTVPVPHPAGTNTAPDMVLYSKESAVKAVTVMLDVICTCIDRPKAALPDLAVHLERVRAFMNGLSADRVVA